MSDFSVVKIGNKQYKVSKGDVIQVDLLDKDKGKIEIKEVLLVSKASKVQVGDPFVQNVSVEAKVLGEVKGAKVKIRKYKAKSRYRKSKGHRAKFTSIEITKV